MRRPTTVVVTTLLAAICGAYVFAAPQAQTATPTATQKPATADVLLGQALHQEQNEGRLQDAIATYAKVLAAPDATRAQKARAQFRIGACYEKLGAAQGAEARKAYEAVTANYGDQSEFAAQAKARLGAMGANNQRPASTSATARLLWSQEHGTLPTPGNDGGGVASPDGKSLVYTDGESFDLYIYDMATRTSRKLTAGKGCSLPNQPCDMSMYSTVWSPDGKRIAYDWMTDDKEEVRIINADGTGQRTLRQSVPPEGLSIIADWSPDGQTILAFSRRRTPEGPSQTMMAISVADGSVRSLETLEGYVWPGARYSPDGRFIAFQRYKAADVFDSDLFIMRADGSEGRPLLDDPASADLVGWVPDGSGLLFLSDRGSSIGLWTVPVADGRQAGQPRLIKDGFGAASNSSTSITRDGRLFYAVRGSTSDVYLATLDPVSGTLTDTPVNAAAAYVGANIGPAWSPDGKILAFLSGSESRSTDAQVLHTVDLDTGARRRVTLADAASVFSAYAIAGTGDDRAFLTELRGRDGVFSLGRVNMMTGATMQNIPRFDLLTFSTDGTRAYSIVRDKEAKVGALSVTDIATRQTQEVWRSPELFPLGNRPAISPDGTLVACYQSTGPKREATVIKVANITSGEVKTLHTTEEPAGLRRLVFSPDGTRLYFSTQVFDGADSALWSIPVEGGTPVRSKVSIGLINQIAIHPGGRRVALGARRNLPSEMWVLENFLPPAKK